MTLSVQKKVRQMVRGFSNTPVGFRELLQSLGPSFVKIGQYLALRPDLLPDSYRDELLKLLDQVPPFSWTEAHAILKADLGSDFELNFEFFHRRPLAAGSLAQTHVARLSSGQEVAVKILRPGIREQIVIDLKRARRLTRILDISRVPLSISPREVLSEVERGLLQEIDLTYELRNLERIFELNRGSKILKVPEPYPELSSGRILVAEYLRGIPVSEILYVKESVSPRNGERIGALGLNRDRLAENLLTATLDQIFRQHFFHADLHPGNLIAMKDNRIGFVDFGLCDESDAWVQRDQLRYIRAIYEADIEQMFMSLSTMLNPGNSTDMSAFKDDFYRQTKIWINERGSSGYSGEQQNRKSSLARWMIGVMQIIRRNGLQVPARILSMYRALLTAETVAHQLKTESDLQVVARQFFEKLQIEEVIQGLNPQKLQPALLTLVNFLRDAPHQVQKILSGLAEGNLALQADITESRPVARVRNARTRLIASSIFAVHLAVLLTMGDFQLIAAVSFKQLVWVMLISNYLWILIEWRRLK